MEQKKALREKKNAIIACIIIGVVVVLLFLAFIHGTRIMEEDSRIGFFDALQKGFNEIFNIKKINHVSFAKAGTFMLFLVAIGCFGFIALMNSKLRKHDSPENESDHWMTPGEQKIYNSTKTDVIGSPKVTGYKNFIMSTDMYLSMQVYKTNRNLNTLVLGGSGTGKSRSEVGPNMLQHNSNYVVTDPKGELLDMYGKFLEDHGYNVKVFNLVDVYKGNKYNPFHYIRTEKDVYTLVDTLIANTTENAKAAGGDPFWVNSEKLLLNALILYIWHMADPTEQTFTNVVRLVNLSAASEDDMDKGVESKVDKLFNDLEKMDPQNLAVAEYKTFKLGAGKTLKSILISTGVRLRAFKLSDIKYLTQKDEMELEKFADSKQALFIIIPTSDKTFNFLVSLLYSQLFMTLYYYVENTVTFGWEAITKNGDVIAVEQASNDDESAEAEKKIKALVAKIKKNGVEIKKDKEKRLFKVYTKGKHPELVGWRGTQQLTDEFIASLKTLKAERCARTCPNHVRFILDEFANIGQIPEFDTRLSTIRSYSISCTIILQSLGQLEKLYEKEKDIIVSNCDTKVNLGVSDEKTCEYFEKIAGNKFARFESETYNGRNAGSTNLNWTKVPLAPASWWNKMPDTHCAVFVKGCSPWYGKKYDLTKHPLYNFMMERKGMFRIPDAEKDRKGFTVLPVHERLAQRAEELKRFTQEDKANMSASKEGRAVNVSTGDGSLLEGGNSAFAQTPAASATATKKQAAGEHKKPLNKKSQGNNKKIISSHNKNEKKTESSEDLKKKIDNLPLKYGQLSQKEINEKKKKFYAEREKQKNEMKKQAAAENKMKRLPDKRDDTAPFGTAFMQAAKVKPDDDLEVIKEKTETMIELMTAPEGEMKFFRTA